MATLPWRAPELHLESIEEDGAGIVLVRRRRVRWPVEQHRASDHGEQRLHEVGGDPGEIGETVDHERPGRERGRSQAAQRLGGPLRGLLGAAGLELVEPPGDLGRDLDESPRALPTRRRHPIAQLADLLQHRLLVVGAVARVEQVAHGGLDGAVAVVEVGESLPEPGVARGATPHEELEGRGAAPGVLAGPLQHLESHLLEGLHDHPGEGAAGGGDEPREQVAAQARRRHDHAQRRAELARAAGGEPRHHLE